MPTLGTKSKRELEHVDPRLVLVVQAAVEIFDLTVIQGIRTEEEAAMNVVRGKSWTTHSKHLPDSRGLARAVDLAPWPVNWKDTEMFCVMAGVMLACAATLGLKLRWGGDWNQNRSTTDENPAKRDYGHFEIFEP